MVQSPKINQDILYERLLKFGQENLILVMELPKAVFNLEYGRQLIRSSASPGSNYIEAIEAGSRREFIHKLKTCRKEIKESIHWLVLIRFANKDKKVRDECERLIKEARELIKIFTSSILTAEKNRKIRK